VAEARIRPATDGDIPVAYAVLEACRLGPWFELSAEQFRAWWPMYKGTWLAEADEVVGFAATRGGSVEVYVLPGARRRGLGTLLLAEAEAVAEGPRLDANARRDEPAAAPFLEGHGYKRSLEVWLMQMELDRESREPTWPAGIGVRTFRLEEAGDVKNLLDAAYAAEPGFRMRPFEDWRRFMLNDTSFEPESWFIAETAEGSLAGAALNWKEGFVKDLVVDPAYRRRGIGEALMLHTFRHFKARGAARVSLKTDSRNTSQAWRFYEHLGMRKTRTYDEFEKRRER
jgi:mycothiol synthase